MSKQEVNGESYDNLYAYDKRSTSLRHHNVQQIHLTLKIFGTFIMCVDRYGCKLLLNWLEAAHNHQAEIPVKHHLWIQEI